MSDANDPTGNAVPEPSSGFETPPSQDATNLAAASSVPESSAPGDSSQEAGEEIRQLLDVEAPPEGTPQEAEAGAAPEESTSQLCPNCGERNGPAMSWCEACGADLAASPDEAQAALPCAACDAPPSSITPDGWCEECGQRQPNKRDHQIVDLGVVFGATNKGLRHHRNEDAMAMAVTDVGSVAVVCDGVSSTERPDEASQAAANAALDVLVAAGADSDPNATPPTVAQAMVAAAGAAQDRVVEISNESQGGEPPSCTFVAAVTEQVPEGLSVVIGWLGDSRAYWIADGGAELLTTDHSWAEHQRALGELAEADIVSDRRAHSITRWIGVDVDDPVPDLVERIFDTPGTLVLCTDGLWNYAEAPEDLAARVDEARTASNTGAGVVEHLVAFANASGGRDNITVCVVDATKPATQN